MADLESNWLPPPESLGQRKLEEAFGIRLCVRDRGTRGDGDLNIRDWRLFLGIGVLSDDRTSQQHALPAVNGYKYYRHHTGKKHGHNRPGHDLSGSSHQVTTANLTAWAF